jgi:import inner membrane translocase subunit TIM16
VLFRSQYPIEITREEAMKILNITEKSTRVEMVERFEHLFKVNDREKGGSHYLQSKVLRAREALENVFLEHPK